MKVHPRPWSFCINYAEIFVQSLDWLCHVAIELCGMMLKVGTTLCSGIWTRRTTKRWQMSPRPVKQHVSASQTRRAWQLLSMLGLLRACHWLSWLYVLSCQVIMNGEYFGSQKIASCDKDFDASTLVVLLEILHLARSVVESWAFRLIWPLGHRSPTCRLICKKNFWKLQAQVLRLQLMSRV